jgi:hypothetical protein
LAQRSGSGPTELDEETADSINRQRGAGQQLDEAMATKAGAVMGHDFSDVNPSTPTARPTSFRSSLGPKPLPPAAIFSSAKGLTIRPAATASS